MAVLSVGIPSLNTEVFSSQPQSLYPDTHGTSQQWYSSHSLEYSRIQGIAMLQMIIIEWWKMWFIFSMTKNWIRPPYHAHKGGKCVILRVQSLFYHWNGKVIRVTSLVFIGDVEGKLQCLQRIPGLSPWQPFCFCDNQSLSLLSSLHYHLISRVSCQKGPICHV